MRIIALILLVFFAQSAKAGDLEQVKDYLAGFSSMEADFTQVNEGEVRKGRILISRPGLARWEYEAPGKSLIIVNNQDIMHYDYELDQLAYDSLPPTPLRILLDKDLKLTKDINLDGIAKENGDVLAQFSARPTQESEPEKLVFVFNAKPFLLKKISRIDSNNTSTDLVLKNLKLNSDPDKALFSMANPRNKI